MKATGRHPPQKAGWDYRCASVMGPCTAPKRCRFRAPITTTLARALTRPRDITLDDLSIELFFPADDHTDAALRGLSGSPSKSSFGPRRPQPPRLR